MDTALIWAAAYLLGSIPCGVLVARSRNVNIRGHGSGNIGATNVARTLGKKEGALTLLGDCSKGFLAAGIASRFLESPSEIALAGFMAFIGHLFPLFLKFKGGKGVATGLGVFMVLTPLAVLSAAAVFALVLIATGYVALSSMLSALALVLFCILFKMPLPYIYAAMAVAALIIQKHRGNIERLWAGTEPRFLGK
ncbi:MAG: glycerol-3-phosphate 1-O-acyltransferase PlsY [Nitrospinales bacterium]